MKNFLLQFIAIGIVFWNQYGCSPAIPADPGLKTISRGNLPLPDTSVQIDGLSSCTTSSDPTLDLRSGEPVTVIVHGCKGSAARFRSLAQIFAFHGQQAICFNYDDRDSLMASSGQLIGALGQLSSVLGSNLVTVIGHSQGGLISRKALVQERKKTLQAGDYSIRLITISAPFGGIRSADHCASPVARILTLGLAVPLCKLISGDKWYEITRPSPFIQQPGELINQVSSHLKIVTDEFDACRLYDDSGECTQGDFVFSIDEQYLEQVDNLPRVDNIEVAAGHVEIVGDYYNPPLKLIALLQNKGIMSATLPDEKQELDVLLTRLYKERE